MAVKVACWKHKQLQMLKTDEGKKRLYLLALVTLYVATRLLFVAVGIQMGDVKDNELDNRFMQHLDTLALKSDLAASVYHLHSQPPLFNLIIGGIYKLFPHHLKAGFVLLNYTMSLLTVLLAFLTLSAVRVRYWVSFVIAALLAISPSLIVYENWPRYTMTVMFFLSLALFSLIHYLFQNLRRFGVLFAVSISALALTRASWHLVWVLAVVGLLIYELRHTRFKEIAALSAIAVILVGTFYVKNQVVFGFFGLSSWVGMNMARISTSRMDKSLVADLVGQGKLSKYALQRPFRQIEAYDYPESDAYAHPVLVNAKKHTGHANFNHYGYIAVSNRYLKDALYLIRHYPLKYLKSVRSAAVNYLRPSVWHIRYRIAPLKTYTGIYDKVVGGKIAKGQHVFLMTMIPLLTLYGLLGFFRRFQLKELRTLARVMAVTLLYCTPVFILMECGENSKFRYELTPAFLLALGLLIENILRRRSIKGVLLTDVIA
jgi:hypothetical protein